MLMTEHKDLATMEANLRKLTQSFNASSAMTPNKGKATENVLKFEKVVADRLAREIVLEPRR